MCEYLCTSIFLGETLSRNGKTACKQPHHYILQGIYVLS